MNMKTWSSTVRITLVLYGRVKEVKIQKPPKCSLTKNKEDGHVSLTTSTSTIQIKKKSCQLAWKQELGGLCEWGKVSKTKTQFEWVILRNMESMRTHNLWRLTSGYWPQNWGDLGERSSANTVSMYSCTSLPLSTAMGHFICMWD